MARPEKPENVRLTHPVTTWLNDADYRALQQVAKRHGVAASSYMRGIIYDAVVEDTESKLVVPMVKSTVRVVAGDGVAEGRQPAQEQGSFGTVRPTGATSLRLQER